MLFVNIMVENAVSAVFKEAPMFWTRLASGVVLVAVAVITIIAGGNIWFGLVALLSLIGLRELYKTMTIEKSIPAGIG